MDGQTDDLVNNLLTFMHLCEDDRGKIAVSLKSMDGAIPTMGDVRSTSRHEFLIPRNDGAPAIWPVDNKVILSSDDLGFAPDEVWPPGTMQFHRTRTIATKDARRLGASRFSRLMVMDEMVAAMPDGTTKSGGGPYAYQGGSWVAAAPLAIRYPPGRSDAIRMSLGWMLAVRYEWTIWLGYTSGPRIRFLSDPLARVRHSDSVTSLKDGCAARPFATGSALIGGSNAKMRKMRPGSKSIYEAPSISRGTA